VRSRVGLCATAHMLTRAQPADAAECLRMLSLGDYEASANPRPRQSPRCCVACCWGAVGCCQQRGFADKSDPRARFCRSRNALWASSLVTHRFHDERPRVASSLREEVRFDTLALVRSAGCFRAGCKPHRDNGRSGPAESASLLAEPAFGFRGGSGSSWQRKAGALHGASFSRATFEVGFARLKTTRRTTAQPRWQVPSANSRTRAARSRVGE